VVASYGKRMSVAGGGCVFRTARCCGVYLGTFKLGEWWEAECALTGNSAT